MTETEAPDLERALRALAQPEPVQRRLFPAFVSVPEELALDFHDALRSFRAGARPDQLHLPPLDDLDVFLDGLSDAQHAAFWTLDALAGDPRWETVRSKAREALSSFGWTSDPPDPSSAAYVRASEPAG